jgi:hypothetical protein
MNINTGMKNKEENNGELDKRKKKNNSKMTSSLPP